MKINNINDSVMLVKKRITDPSKEHCFGVYLDPDGNIKGIELISIGSLTASIVEPREVFRPALYFNATNVILLHNHPSGQLLPSPQDKNVMRMIKKSGDILHIQMVDSLIFNMDGEYYSMVVKKKFSYTKLDKK